MLQKLSGLVALLGAVSVLAACGTNGDAPDEAGEPRTHTAANGDTYNDADVEFASDLIQHHALALAMVDLTMDRRLDPEMRRLADGIRMARGPEIEQLTDWLQDWDQPIPETVRDHANAHQDGETEMGSDLPGVMSSGQLAELEGAEGAQFEKAWLALMIEHHEGAIELARTEQSDGEHAAAVELAGTIASAQQEEISTMQVLLGS